MIQRPCATSCAAKGTMSSSISLLGLQSIMYCDCNVVRALQLIGQIKQACASSLEGQCKEAWGSFMRIVHRGRGGDRGERGGRKGGVGSAEGQLLN